MNERYVVLSQRQMIGRLPDDSFGPIVRITFRTRAGAVLAVDVPASDYTVENVAAIIQERVDHADQIANL